MELKPGQEIIKIYLDTKNPIDSAKRYFVGYTRKGDIVYEHESGGIFSASLDRIVLPKIKKEGWVNIYPRNIGVSSIHPSKEAADRNAQPSRIACSKVEWEEDQK